MKIKSLVLLVVLSVFPFSSVFAGEGALNSGDTAWMIVATALVMMMTPAGSGSILWRDVTVQKSSEYICNDICIILYRKYHLGCMRIYSRVWSG